MEKRGKAHDKLPKKLMSYLRGPANTKRRGRSGSPSRTNRGGKDPTKRWATKYCWSFADGKCQKTEEECGRGPHISEEEAKKRAEGKTIGDTGYDPNKTQKRRPVATGLVVPDPAIMLMARAEQLACTSGKPEPRQG